MNLHFITASHNSEICDNNLRRSKLFSVQKSKEELKKFRFSLDTMFGYDNVSKAYNHVTSVHANSLTDKNSIFIYLHHDVFLPDDFENNLLHSLEQVNKIDPDWGVLGVAGAWRLIASQTGGSDMNGYHPGRTLYQRQFIGHIKDRGMNWQWGNPKNFPEKCDTLDELLLITHGDFRFDENLPQDFYGADICMQSKLQGRKNYVINAYCHHNSTRKIGERTPSFFTSQEYFKNKYREHLPIMTTCAIVQ